ncbi:hypothetical protein TSUD_412450 [Trifolium subterraneum]|uniref:Histone deacetylase interacting domain-containing protein n=1 Tax=Trifolium subterraneum TaxID=3900 RepID=A0A2Z6PKC5_TRISU|nr:hypothetical protein TSUD_412450 [Trifolium subterraneum]
MKDSSNETSQMSLDQANMYLTEIKDAFKEDLGKFNEFLKSMRDFTTRRIDMVGLKSRVKELFKGHNQLLMKFNAFLPNEAEVEDEDEDEVSSQRQPIVNVEYAMKYVLNVKTKFRHNPQIYKSFVDIIKMYKNKDKSAEEVRQMVISLFEGHQDLVDGFMVFHG